MTDNSSLFQEIDEDLQRKKIEEIWKRYGNHIIGGALAIVLATAGYNGWQAYTIRQEQKATAAILNVVNDKKIEADRQVELLDHFAKTNPGIAQSFLARFEAASVALRDGKDDKALEIYNGIAADPSVELTFRQLADLMAVQAQLDNGDPAALQPRLDKLMAESPWKASAKELSAYLALRVGDKAKAKKLFTELTTDADVPNSMQYRATDMVRWLSDQGEGN